MPQCWCQCQSVSMSEYQCPPNPKKERCESSLSRCESLPNRRSTLCVPFSLPFPLPSLPVPSLPGFSHSLCVDVCEWAIPVLPSVSLMVSDDGFGGKKDQKKGEENPRALTHLLTLSLMCSIHHYRSNPIPSNPKRGAKKRK